MEQRGTKKKGERCKGEAGLGYCPFSSYGHDTVCCVTIGRAQARSPERDMERQRCDMTQQRARDMVFVSLHDFFVAIGSGMRAVT